MSALNTVDPASIIEPNLPRIVDLRHRLHRIPELGYQEVKTAATIRAELDALSITYVAGPSDAPTATIACIGDQSKPCIALRADIDALPIAERTNLPYASTHAGLMHACGHDGHSSVLVGVAAVLQQIADQLPVCAKLIWQPAEEGGAGAERLIKAGVLDGRLGPKVSAIFGLHGWPALPIGRIATRPGEILAAVDNFEVRIDGRDAHAGYPHLGRDPIVAAAEAIVSLQSIVSREVDPTESCVITVGTIKAGSAVNIIPPSATFAGTVRTLSESVRHSARNAMERRLAAIAAAHECQLDFTWFEGYPVTVNDPAMADYVARVARQTVGNDRYIPVAKPSMGGEDFACYLQKVPGCFFFLGLLPPGVAALPSLHSDHFDFADAAIAPAISMFVALARNFGA
jgi:amidohydrolase